MNPESAWGSLTHSLLRIQDPRSLDSMLNDLLERRVNLSSGIRSTASDSHNHLREFLSAESSRDAGFPRVLSKAGSDFLGGSFARHTKIWPLDDIDIYVPLDGGSLFYFDMQTGQRLPYTVQSDGGLFRNPLCSDRWMDWGYISSIKLISEFRRVLARRYSTGTRVRKDGTCVSIQMAQGESRNADGLGYDVVPCFCLRPDAPNELEFYLIPDGAGGWARTNPKLDNDLCGILHAFHNRTYRKVVKLAKYWNTAQLDSAFSSYYIELAISRDFWNRRAVGQSISSVAEGLAAAFDTLEPTYLAGDQKSWIPGAPPIRPPALSLKQAGGLKLARAVSGLAWKSAQSGRLDDARRNWSVLFGELL